MNIKYLDFAEMNLDGGAEEEDIVPFFRIQLCHSKDLDLGIYFMLINNPEISSSSLAFIHNYSYRNSCMSKKV